MRNSCLALSNPSAAGETKTDGEALLEVRKQIQNIHTFLHAQTHAVFLISFLLPGQKLFTATDAILSPGLMENSKHVSGLLSTLENSIMLIGPQLKHNSSKIETTETGNSVHKLCRL